MGLWYLSSHACQVCSVCMIYSPCCATDNSLGFRKYFCFYALENINSVALIPSRNEYKASCLWQGIWVPLEDFNIERVVALFLPRELKLQLSTTLNAFLSISHLNCTVLYGKGSEYTGETGKDSLNNWLHFGGVLRKKIMSSITLVTLSHFSTFPQPCLYLRLCIAAWQASYVPGDISLSSKETRHPCSIPTNLKTFLSRSESELWLSQGNRNLAMLCKLVFRYSPVPAQGRALQIVLNATNTI